MAQSWMIDPRSGDYVMDGGSPKQTDSLVIPAYYRLKIRRKGWIYAPDSDYGSDLHLLKKRKTNGNASAVENTAARALQPIIDDERANTIELTTTVATRNTVGLETKITDARGIVQTFVLPQI